MANEEQLRILQQGVAAWNKWRMQNSDEQIDLSGAELNGANLNGAELNRANLNGAELNGASLIRAYLSEAYLSNAYLIKANLEGAFFRSADLNGASLREANLTDTDLNGADLSEAYINNATLMGAKLIRTKLIEADLHSADLRRADLSEAFLIRANLIYTDLSEAILRGADLTRARLTRADLSGADLSGADLSEAKLSGSVLVESILKGSILNGCNVYGISAWELELDGATQNDLIITRDNEPAITVDNLEVAQFIYLLLHNEKVRQVIDTITSKVVLILGRFTDKRKAVLDAIREELRKHDYLPILFDFDKPGSRDLTETISTLAHMSRFIIADITDAKSIPAELQSIVPNLPSVPVIPLILNSEYEYALFEHIRKYPWVLESYRYEDQGKLIANIKENVVAPAEKMLDDLRD